MPRYEDGASVSSLSCSRRCSSGTTSRSRSICRRSLSLSPLSADTGACITPRSSSGSRRSEEHTSELQSLMRISYAVFCLKKKNKLQHLSYDLRTHEHRDTDNQPNHRRHVQV